MTQAEMQAQMIQTLAKIPQIEFKDSKEALSYIVTEARPFWVEEDTVAKTVKVLASVSEATAPIASSAVAVFSVLDMFSLGTDVEFKAPQAIAELTSVVSASFEAYSNEDVTDIDNNIDNLNKTLKQDYNIDLINKEGKYNLFLIVLFLGVYSLFDTYVILLCLMLAMTVNGSKKETGDEIKELLKSYNQRLHYKHPTIFNSNLDLTSQDL